MTVSGSSLVNTSAVGQPTLNEDRPFSFAMGTQIFLNPTSSPTDAVLSFKIDPGLLNGSLASGVSNLAVGFAVDSELNNLSAWTSSLIGTPSANIFPIGFGRLASSSEQVAVNIQGTEVATVARPSTVTTVDGNANSFSITGHPFTRGDQVTISSTGTVPGGLATGTPYYVITVDADTIKLATTYANANAGSDIDIQTTGSGTITIASDENFTLTRAGSSGTVTVKKGSVTVATFTNTNVASPLRPFYWCREQSASNSLPVVKEIKVRGAI